MTGRVSTDIHILSEKRAAPRALESLRLRLRRKTRGRHARLDAAFGDLGATGDPVAYRLFLRVSEACHRGIEPALAASGLFAAMPEMRCDPRHAAVAADMKAMNLQPLVLAPFPFEAPRLCEAVGIAYVLEGSRLGARMILNRLSRDRRADARLPVTTFFLETAGSAGRFRDYMDRADAVLETDRERRRAVEAAGATFDYFLNAVRVATTAPGGTL